MIQDVSRTVKTRTFSFYVSPLIDAPDDLRWATAYISSVIYHGMASMAHAEGVPVSDKWLRAVLGRAGHQGLVYLLDIGAIERVGGYVVDESPYHYALVPPYDECVPVVCDDAKLVSRLRGLLDQRLPVINWLDARVKLLGIDYEAALAHAATLPPKAGHSVWESVKHSQYRIQIIADGNSEVSMDAIHGRVFAAHTGLRCELRRFLRSPDGQPIVSLDIRNCQPALLSLAVARYYSEDRRQRNRILSDTLEPKRNPYLWPQLKTAGKYLNVAKMCLANSLSDTMLEKTVRHIEEDRPKRVSPRVSIRADSLARWLSLAESGRLYEFFGDDREAVKKEMVLAMFGQRPLLSHRVGRILETDFPAVAEVITAMKRKNVLAKQHDPRPFRYLACTLQLYESTLMIYRVCGRIMRERPETPVWTIHDSMLTSVPHKEYVESVLRAEFALVGLSPSLKETLL